MHRIGLLGATGALAIAASISGPASATTLHDVTVSSCTGVNCSSTEFAGSVNAFQSSVAGPWVAQIWGGPNTCLRLDLTTQGNQDLEIVAVAPNGSVFFNDDRTGGDLRPLVKINGTQNGWYTVHVHQWQGIAIDTNFRLAYGVYNVNNPNCAAPTAPLSGAAANSVKSGGRGR